MGHPMVIGEIALGTLKERARILEALDDLPGTTDRLEQLAGGRAGSGDLGDGGTRGRRDPAHALEKIESRALPRKEREKLRKAREAAAKAQEKAPN